MTSLSIGVVSHERSRFAASQGDGGLAARLVTPLAAHDIVVSVMVNTADLLDPAVIAIDTSTVQASLSAELAIERRWAAFLGRTRQPHWWVRHGMQTARRTARRVSPPGAAMVRRLINIELSHLDLMHRALDAGSDWLLLLEDDAHAADVDDCAAGLAGLMRTVGPPAYVNVSASFSLETLGVVGLLHPVGPWQGSVPRTLFGSSRPFTNTVCAILYRREFLVSLVAALDAIPIEPVLPIDWKLNAALMELWDAGLLHDGDCWAVEPAPIDQQSMRTME